MPHRPAPGDKPTCRNRVTLDATVRHHTRMRLRTTPILLAILIATASCGALDTQTGGGDALAATTTAAPPTAPTDPTNATDTPDQTTSAPLATTEQPTTTTAAPPEWIVERTAIFGPGADDWESNFVVPGAVLEHDGMLHMFYVGYDVEGTSVERGAVGHVISGDGVDWARVTPGPLFDAAGLDWTEAGIVPGGAIVEPDGTWVVYFHTTPRSFAWRGGVIGRATAPAPEGPWTVHPEPLVIPGGEGTWDAKGLAHPSVAATDDGYFMYYDAHIDDVDDQPNRRIGMATSSDGIVWEKWNDPATTDEPYAASDPVLGLGGNEAWDALRVQHPTVVRQGDRWVMTYESQHRHPRQPGRVWDFGYALSDDGVTWERAEGNPFFTTIDLYEFVTSSAFVIFEGTGLFYFDAAGSIQSPSNGVFVARHPEPFA
jgi:hypothetical protein